MMSSSPRSLPITGWKTGRTSNASSPSGSSKAGWLAGPLLALSLLLPSALATAPAPRAQATGASQVRHVLRQLKQEKGGVGPQEFHLREDDLNDFARSAARARPRLGVRDVELDFRPDGSIRARAVLDMGKVELSGYVSSMFKSAVRGQQTFKCIGRLQVNGGKAQFEIQEASFNENWVPAWLAGSLIGYLGQGQPPIIDFTQPFDLPYGIKDVRIRADELLITR